MGEAVEEVAFHLDADAVGECADKEDGDAVKESVDVLFAVAQGASDGVAHKPLGRLQHSETDREPLKVLGQAEKVSGYAPGAGHGDAHSGVFQLKAQGAAERADVGFGGGIHGNAGHRHPAAHGTHVENHSGAARRHFRSNGATNLRQTPDMEVNVEVKATLGEVADGLEVEYPGIVNPKVGQYAYAVKPRHNPIRRIGVGQVDGKGVRVTGNFRAVHFKHTPTAFRQLAAELRADA